MLTTHLRALAATLALVVGAAASAQTIMVSTQLRPIEEAEKFRNAIAKGAADPVNFIPEDPNTYLTRMSAELQGTKGKVHVTAGLDGELSSVHAQGGLLEVDDIVKKLSADRQFSASALQLGKLSSSNQRFIPWMQNTFQMAANRKALQYLPKGADINALTYEQLKQWAKAMKEATGEAKFGLPAGPKGLLHRFMQASAYPSYTGGIVKTFKNADAQKMWADLKELWQYTNPRSTAYGFMEEPLRSGEVWVAFDHTARLLPALNEKPADFVTFPAPAGPKGRGVMPIIAGLAIPKNTPDKAAAERLIDHLTKPQTQNITLQQVGFFPVVRTDAAQLPEGVKLAQNGVNLTFGAKDSVVSMLPAGLGAKSGEFNKVYLDTFQRIIIRNEDIAKTLAEQAKALDTVIQEAKVPCWAPDSSSGNQPCAVQ
jgi:multiple sugar transport system substrate-binding protein